MNGRLISFLMTHSDWRGNILWWIHLSDSWLKKWMSKERNGISLQLTSKSIVLWNSLVIGLVQFCRYGRRNMKVPYPIRYATPYGGRLIWKLPGNTKIICHLKDKNKIRHKKRWSQIMYMYYFLGHKLVDNVNLSERQKQARKRNTYLLALDGDVDFQVW